MIPLETLGALLEKGTFALLAAGTVFFAAFAVLAKDIVRAGLALIMCMFGIAALYIFLNAQFLGIVQVLVYIGAIGVLILFAVMLTRSGGVSDGD